jgi:hypothetical protein
MTGACASSVVPGNQGYGDSAVGAGNSGISDALGAWGQLKDELRLFLMDRSAGSRGRTPW